MRKILSVSVLCLLSLGLLNASGPLTPGKMLKRIDSRSRRVVEVYGNGFDYTRSIRVQAALLAEQVAWDNNDSLTEVEIAAVVYMAVHISVEKAKIELDSEDIEFERAAHIYSYLKKSDDVLTEWGRKCKDITDKQLGKLSVRN